MQRILVVEDEPTIAQAVAARLVAEGFEVRVAADGPAAVEQSRAYGPNGGYRVSPEENIGPVRSRTNSRSSTDHEPSSRCAGRCRSRSSGFPYRGFNSCMYGHPPGSRVRFGPAAWIVEQHYAIQAAIGDGSPVSR
jgi:hypothetical protein